MDNLTKFFSGIDQIRFTRGGTFVDRLQYKYTPMILGLLAVVMMALQFIGEFSISCWCPAQFTDSMVEYTNRRCWTTRTYHIPFNTPDIPREEKLKPHISYYQWVPAILFLQAFMFFVPSQIWRFISGKTGIGVSKIVDKARKYDFEEDGDAKKAILDDMVMRIMLFSSNKELHGLKKFLRVIRDNSLPFLYLIAKILYCLNAMLQMKIMNELLGGTGMFGYVREVIRHVRDTGYWPESAKFPTVTLCDFAMRVHHNIHNHTVQCALPLNFYHEKLFVSLWVWYFFLAGIALFSFVAWTVWVLTDVIRYIMTVRKHEHLPPYSRTVSAMNTDESIKRFMFANFRANGLFVKRMVQSNVGLYVTKQFIRGIREDLKETQEMEAAKTGNKPDKNENLPKRDDEKVPLTPSETSSEDSAVKRHP